MRRDCLPRKLRIRSSLITEFRNRLTFTWAFVKFRKEFSQVVPRRARHFSGIVRVYINVIASDQLAITFKDFFARCVVRDDLGNLTCRMFKVDQAPALTLASIYTYVTGVIDAVQHVHLDIRRMIPLGRTDDSTVRIEALLLHFPCEHRHDVPALVLTAHV